MKQEDSKKVTGRLPDDVRARVLELRRANSLSRVAKLTGLPLGTVKTLCSRSGVFRDNLEHRALFTLPPIKESTNTAVSVPELPPQQAVTGDKEVDAVLWLHTVIRTGQPALIDKAMLAAQKIKTPLKTLEKRYQDFMMRAHPGNPFAGLSAIGFGDLEGLARSSVEKLARQREARSRFGEDDVLYAETPAEQFCKKVLTGVGSGKHGWEFDKKQVDSKFFEHPKFLPQTLSDCLYELKYWRELYCLRSSVYRDSGDSTPEAQERDTFVFRMLAKIRPKSKEEAILTFRYMAETSSLNYSDAPDILMNLVGGSVS